MTTAKQAIAYGHISRAVVLAAAKGLTGYEATLLRIQDEDMMGRDLTRAERNARANASHKGGPRGGLHSIRTAKASHQMTRVHALGAQSARCSQTGIL